MNLKSKISGKLELTGFQEIDLPIPKETLDKYKTIQSNHSIIRRRDKAIIDKLETFRIISNSNISCIKRDLGEVKYKVSNDRYKVISISYKLRFTYKEYCSYYKKFKNTQYLKDYLYSLKDSLDTKYSHCNEIDDYISYFEYILEINDKKTYLKKLKKLILNLIDRVLEPKLRLNDKKSVENHISKIIKKALFLKWEYAEIHIYIKYYFHEFTDLNINLFDITKIIAKTEEIPLNQLKWQAIITNENIQLNRFELKKAKEDCLDKFYLKWWLKHSKNGTYHIPIKNIKSILEVGQEVASNIRNMGNEEMKIVNENHVKTSKAQNTRNTIQQWRKENPNINNKRRCSRETGLSYNSIRGHWD